MSRLAVLTDQQDAFGHALLDHLEHGGGEEIVERSDGHIGLSAGAATYFAEPNEEQRRVVERARGRVLDIGCGAGRFALYLQARGHDVVGIDISPGAVEVCRRRGLRDVRLLSITDISRSLGTFDTVVMLGNNFGLLGSFARARRLLRRFSRVVSPGGHIIAETLDPYQTSDATHLAYHAQNRARGRMGGQIRLRVRYECYRSPWFDYLFVSRSELESIVTDTGWRIAELISTTGPNYVAVLGR
jgi:2-polyprenyl-3-methyl-5-hydroxy-6-metoxy-1,4-benzoquinol methylase